MKNIRVFIMIIAAVTTLRATAQKLPNLQVPSVYAPADIKIDGSAAEWGDQFQAYNTATDIFYTISNDDANLYLTVKAAKPRIIQKILAVGITFIMNTSNVKSNQESLSINFPVLTVADAQNIISLIGIKSNIAIFKANANSHEKEFIPQSDSLRAIANNFLSAKSREIKIKGKNGLTDTISVYNAQKIQVASSFNNQTAYIFELSIPLKALKLKPNRHDKFNYSIKLISRLDDFKKGNRMVYRYGKDDAQIDADQDLDSTTDFSGEYSLAKKP